MKTFFLKLSWKVVLIPIASFLIPIKALMIIVGIFIAIDTYYGVWKAKKLGKKITSRAFSAIVSKFALYQLSVITGYAMEMFVLQDFLLIFTDIHLVLTKLIVATLVGLELGSINENYKAVKGYTLWTKVKTMFKRGAVEIGEMKDEYDTVKKKLKK
jgi:hypothetical protein